MIHSWPPCGPKAADLRLDWSLWLGEMRKGGFYAAKMRPDYVRSGLL